MWIGRDEITNGLVRCVKELDFLLKAIGNYCSVFKWEVTKLELQLGKITESREKLGLGREPEVGRSARRQEMVTQAHVTGIGTRN